MSGASATSPISQEKIVVAISVAIFALFSLIIPDFLSTSNVSSLVQNIAILGILGVAMAITIIGRGIDLSLVTSMSVSVAWMLNLLNSGVPMSVALPLAIGFSILVGLTNGFLVAYVEVPAIFATLAMGTLVYGFGKYFLVQTDVVYLPDAWRWLSRAVTGKLAGVPIPVIIFLAIAALAALFLRYARDGRFIYAMGENPEAARTSGLSVRVIIVQQYVLSALIALAAGLLMSMLVASMNTRISSSTMVYDVILVVVLGGIGLSGGRGGIHSVIVGTLLIGVLVNGMTMLNLNYTMQNVIKALILLVALTLDAFINPRDEQTSQQGDI